ncbi:hypothetical protein [Schlesneria paludicola]|uniref:hypothetical protein n=1 Tax=Schlesneria paludicola TaxID=360056 RepID=UPI0012F8F7D1|nr:hypothetical protein [Schlesneria paludicola]
MPSLGCARLMNLHLTDSHPQGLTLVLTGIESAHLGHASFVRGLKRGGVESEIEIVDWTTGTPALMLYHLMSESRNRAQATLIASKIVHFQDAHPGCPVNLIGHSGGGGMVLLTLDALPADRQVDSAILLAAAISPDYDLRSALCKVRRGIWNYSSQIGDAPLLVAGTTLFGTIDRHYGPAAGATGFHVPNNPYDFQLYHQKLFQRPYDFSMALDGNFSNHYGPMSPRFARRELAPILLARNTTD